MSRAHRDRLSVRVDISPDGQQVPEYETKYRNIPCRFIPKSVYESRRGRQLEAGVTLVIELRWYEDLVRPDDVITNEQTNQTYSVRGSVNVDGMGREMLIYCNEVVL